MKIKDIYNIKHFSIKKWVQNIFLSFLLLSLWAFSSFANNSSISPAQKDLIHSSTGLENSKRRVWNTQEDGSFLTLERLKEAVKKYNRTASPSEKISTRLSYIKYCSNIPGAPSNPDKFYKKEEWKQIGKWRGLLGPKFIQTIPELQKAIVGYNKTVPEDEKISTVLSYHKYRHKIPGAHSLPNSFYREEWEKQGKWQGLLRQNFIPTILELKKAITEYNKKAPESRKIVTVLSYKKYRYKIPGAPSTPVKFYYKGEWKERGKWQGLLGPKFIQTIPELQKAITKYNKTAPEGEKIVDAKSYRKNYKKIPKAPSTPNFSYKEEWERQGKWRGLFSGVKRCELEFITKIK